MRPTTITIFTSLCLLAATHLFATPVTFADKQQAATAAVRSQFEAAGWPEHAEEVLALIANAETRRVPAAEGYDHQFHALMRELARYSRGRTVDAGDPQQALWYFAAGEAQFAHSQSGAEDYRRFLESHTLSAKDARLAQARARLKAIEKLDQGLSRQ